MKGWTSRVGHGYPDWIYELYCPPVPMGPGAVPTTDLYELQYRAGMITKEEYMAKKIQHEQGEWDTTDPLYIKDIEKELDSYYEKNIEEPFEPDTNNYCDDCREGKKHHMIDHQGEKIRVHKHSELTNLSPCVAVGDLFDKRPCPPRHCRKCRLPENKPPFPYAGPLCMCGPDADIEPEPKPMAYAYTGYNDIDEFLDECLDTMRKKGHDYRQGNDDDLLHNFRSVGNVIEEPMEKVWATYFYKHYSAVMTYVKKGQVESEPIEERVKDMIVYLLLFYRMIKDRQEQQLNEARVEHGIIG